MSRPRKSPAEWLPVMAAAFPHTFFTEPDRVQPLKVNIHQDLFAALPAGVEPPQAARFLSWYVNRLAYQQALLEGKGRRDLTGAVVESEIPPRDPRAGPATLAAAPGHGPVGSARRGGGRAGFHESSGGTVRYGH